MKGHASCQDQRHSMPWCHHKTCLKPISDKPFEDFTTRHHKSCKTSKFQFMDCLKKLIKKIQRLQPRVKITILSQILSLDTEVTHILLHALKQYFNRKEKLTYMKTHRK